MFSNPSTICRELQNRVHSFRSFRSFRSIRSFRHAAASVVPGWLMMIVIAFSASTANAQESLWQDRPAGEDWPTFLGAQQDGISIETGILKDWSGDKLQVVWKLEVGEGYSIGSVSNGRYVHFDRGPEKARIRCFQAETGTLLWTHEYDSVYADLYKYDSGPRTSPVIDGERVYTLGVEGQLICLNLNDGEPIWKVDTSAQFGVVQNFFGVGSTPVVVDDLLLVMVGGSPAESKDAAPGQLTEVKPNGSAVVAFNKLTGKVVYQLGDDLASYSTIKITREFGKDAVGLAFCREALIVFDVKTGNQKASFPWRSKILESVNASTPVVIGDQILISECYGPGSALLQYKDEKLTTLWTDASRREKALKAHWNTPIIHDGFAYASSGRNPGDADLRCFEIATGEIQWRIKGISRASLTMVDGHLIVLGEYGKLFLIRPNPVKFDLVTQFKFEDQEAAPKLAHPCWSAPVVSHGLLFVRGKRNVICFDLIPQGK